MLDEDPRQQPLQQPPLDPIDPTDPTDPTGSLSRDWDAEVRGRGDAPLGVPVPPARVAPTPTASAPTAAGSTTDLIRADMSDAWARLDQPARLLVGGSLAAIVVVLVGLPLSVWDSAPFALLVLVAGIITAVTGWFGASPTFRDLPIPRATIELIATHVVVALAALKAIEILFDLDSEGVVALIVGAALVAAAVVQLVAAQRRGADPLAFSRGDKGAKIGAVGLLLVLVGWLLNLSVSFWTMGQAAVPLAVLTIAALTVAEAPRIPSSVPVAWIGAGIGAFGALIALANWGDLTSLGRTQLTLDPGDFLGLLAYTAGAALIITGGVLSGRDTWAVSHPTAPGPLPEG
jgi:hypothetical protein